MHQVSLSHSLHSWSFETVAVAAEVDVPAPDFQLNWVYNKVNCRLLQQKMITGFVLLNKFAWDEKWMYVFLIKIQQVKWLIKNESRYKSLWIIASSTLSNKLSFSQVKHLHFIFAKKYLPLINRKNAVVDAWWTFQTSLVMMRFELTHHIIQTWWSLITTNPGHLFYY